MPTFRTSSPGFAANPSAGTPHSSPHLILVGLPGAGKTAVARAVGETLRRPVLDFDTEIAEREQASIAEIFAARGEGYFRAAERELTEELQATGGMILSPGAGWIANEGCLALLRPPAVLIYLQVSPQVAVTRMGAAAADRPLLRRPDPEARVRELLAARESLYVQSNHTVSTDSMTQDEVVACIVALARG